MRRGDFQSRSLAGHALVPRYVGVCDVVYHRKLLDVLWHHTRRPVRAHFGALRLGTSIQSYKQVFYSIFALISALENGIEDIQNGTLNVAYSHELIDTKTRGDTRPNA
uniref:AlNc14C437G11636 protein n=1 Tax=Albugo laibachii Nc14 TaxID=890382 RepID=F0WZP6_9STRA|nr:AlNc14C437G11636 [Albugo laibachii Nc14]|eukprot:CCA26972.1 AlNc14C437G11636 [Albugo laibachii Nc14]